LEKVFQEVLNDKELIAMFEKMEWTLENLGSMKEQIIWLGSIKQG
jgi:hypothetical protein